MRMGHMAPGELPPRSGQCSGNKRSEKDGTAHSELLSRITARPDVFGGKPIVRDMRISVEHVLSLLEHGMTADAIVGDYPGLELDDIRACRAYARAVIANDSLSAVSTAEQ